jgi:hypothetical protein
VVRGGDLPGGEHHPGRGGPRRSRPTALLQCRRNSAIHAPDLEWAIPPGIVVANMDTGVTATILIW